MKGYSYHPDTHELVGEFEVELDPIDKTPMLPGDATLIMPPTETANSVSVWEETGWSQKLDHRGEFWWFEGKEKLVDFLGNPEDQGYSLEGPPEVGDNEEAVWEDGEWKAKIDHIGEVWYDGYNNPMVVKAYGNPVDLGWTKENPPPPEVPIPEKTPEDHIIEAPDDFFGGPTLEEVYNGY